MCRVFAVLMVFGVLSYGGCAKHDQPEKSQGIEIHVPGVDIEIDEKQGVNVKAPGTNVHADKEKGLEVKAPGIEFEARPRQSNAESNIE